MESYLLVLASLILLIPIIMYLPLGMTSKGKMIIILGAIIVSLIGIYANMNFHLWQTAGMLLLILAAMTFFLGEKFEGLIFDQEGNDLTDYKREQSEEVIEGKDDLIHIIASQKHTNEEIPVENINQEQSEELIEENSKEIIMKNDDYSQNLVMDTVETNQIIDLKKEQSTEIDEPIDQTIVNWDEDMDLLQDESHLSAEVDQDKSYEETEGQQTIESEEVEFLNEEEISLSDETEPYGSFTNDEVAFLLNKDESMPSDELSVHYMEDIEALLEDEEEDLQPATDLVEEKQAVDLIINVFEEGDLPLIIDDMEETNSFDEQITEDQSKENVLSEFAEFEKDSVNTNELDLEQTKDSVEWSSGDDNPDEQKDAAQLNVLAEEKIVTDDTSVLKVEPVYDDVQEETQSKVEHSALQAQLFDTFFYQMKLAKFSCTDDVYEVLIKDYVTDELPDQTYYQFSTLLLDHYIEKQKWKELKQNLIDLQDRFEQYPILVKQLDYLYQTYCA